MDSLPAACCSNSLSLAFPSTFAATPIFCRQEIIIFCRHEIIPPFFAGNPNKLGTMSPHFTAKRNLHVQLIFRYKTPRPTSDKGREKITHQEKQKASHAQAPISSQQLQQKRPKQPLVLSSNSSDEQNPAKSRPFPRSSTKPHLQTGQTETQPT